MYDIQHAVNVSQLSIKIGKCLGLDTGSLALLNTAGLFHDVGKSLIPEKLLDKPASLSQDEYGIIQWHTTLGHGLLSQMPDDVDISLIAGHSPSANTALS